MARRGVNPPFEGSLLVNYVCFALGINVLLGIFTGEQFWQSYYIWWICVSPSEIEMNETLLIIDEIGFVFEGVSTITQTHIISLHFRSLILKVHTSMQTRSKWKKRHQAARTTLWTKNAIPHKLTVCGLFICRCGSKLWVETLLLM